MQDNEHMPGCNDDAARSPLRKRLQRSCKRCVRKFSKEKQRSARELMRAQREQKDMKQRKKKASRDTSRGSVCRKARRPNGTSTNALIAKQKLTAAFGLEMSKSQGIVESSFGFEIAVVARSFTHSCPRCGMEVQSAKASGRIQSKHKNSYNGKTCPKTEWVVK